MQGYDSLEQAGNIGRTGDQLHSRIKANDDKELGQAIVDGSVLAATGTINTDDTSAFLPYDYLIMTEDGGVNPVTWNLQVRANGEGTLVVDGTGTLSVKARVNGVDGDAIRVFTSANVGQAAATLAAGTYYLRQ